MRVFTLILLGFHSYETAQTSLFSLEIERLSDEVIEYKKWRFLKALLVYNRIRKR